MTEPILPRFPGASAAVYPSAGHAVLLSIAVIVLQVVFSVPLTILSMVSGIPIVQHPAALALINTLAFGVLLGWGLKRNALPAAAVFYLRPIPLRWIAALFVASCGLGIVLSELDNLFRYWVPPPKWAEDFMERLFDAKAKGWGMFLALVIVAPVTEELFFRGLILRGLIARHGFLVAAAISSVLFAAVHLNPWQAMTALILGFVFAWYVQKSGSVFPGIIGHAIHNGLTLCISYLPFEIEGFNTAEMPQVGTFQPWWLDVIGVVLMAAGLWWFKKQVEQRDAQAPAAPPVLFTGAG